MTEYNYKCTEQQETIVRRPDTTMVSTGVKQAVFEKKKIHINKK